jgi:hypothetical protein
LRTKKGLLSARTILLIVGTYISNDFVCYDDVLDDGFTVPNRIRGVPVLLVFYLFVDWR